MVELLFKKGKLQFQLPSGWEAKHIIFKPPKPKTPSLQEMLLRALGHPIGSPRLENLLKPDSKVAVVVDDLTRPTPIKDLIPILLKVIEESGVLKKNITIIIGTGTHRPMDRKEIETRLGQEIVYQYQIENHNPRSEDLVTMGELPEFGKISFNATAMRSDLKITLGSIIPHVHNGFGGGPKNIMPGICNFETIKKHHLKNVLHLNSRVGIVDGNPFLRDLIEIAKLARVDFTIQCLNDSFGNVYAILAGDVMEVFWTGVKEQSTNLGFPVSEKTDITIVSSFPYDEGVQIMKSFMPSAMVTKPGGHLFVATELIQPLPEFFIKSVRQIRGDANCVINPDTLDRLHRCEPLIEGAAMDFNMAIILVVAVARKFNLCLIGHEVLKELAEAIDCKWFPNLNNALQQETNQKGKRTVSIIPAGGYIFPIISEPFDLLN